jgi:hypothetical protein
MLVPIPPNQDPFTAEAFDGEVVIQAAGPGRGVTLAMTPEAVLASLEPLRAAAEAALAQAVRQRTALG